MDIGEILFLILWFVVATFIVFGLFTKKGRNKSIELQFGAKVISDRGVVSEDSMLLGKQIVTLYECEKDGLRFFVMEAKRTAPFGFSYTYVKVDKELIHKLESSLERT